MIEANQRKIKCSIFSAREKLIQELNHDIWREDLMPGEIINKARSLFDEANFLSNCPKYNQARFECKICKAIADLRKRMATYMVGPDVEIKNSPSFSLAVH